MSERIIKRRRPVTIRQRVEILEQFKKGKTVAEIVNDFGISTVTARRIKSNKSKIEELLEKNKTLEMMRYRESKYEAMEQHLHAWFLEQKLLGHTITDGMLQKKALEIMKECDKSSAFTACRGWVWRFKKRYGIRVVTVETEMSETDDEDVKNFMEEFNKELKNENIDKENIYNMDETGLLWRTLPRRVLIRANETRTNEKLKMNLITIGLCVNATGHHKLPLLFIHKNESPRALKHCKSPLPVIYKHNKNACMSQEIFADWYVYFKQSVKKYQFEKGIPGKVLLLVDDYIGHILPVENLQCDNFKVLILPSKIATMIQPMNQGIIEETKKRYRFEMLHRIIDYSGGIKDFYVDYDIKDCIDLLHKSWLNITSYDIQNSWRKIFKQTKKLEGIVVTSTTILQSLLSRITGEDVTSNELIDWLTFCTNAEENCLEEDTKIYENEECNEVDDDELRRALEITSKWAETQGDFVKFHVRMLRDYYEQECIL